MTIAAAARARSSGASSPSEMRRLWLDCGTLHGLFTASQIVPQRRRNGGNRLPRVASQKSP